MLTVDEILLIVHMIGAVLVTSFELYVSISHVKLKYLAILG